MAPGFCVQRQVSGALDRLEHLDVTGAFSFSEAVVCAPQLCSDGIDIGRLGTRRHYVAPVTGLL